jgi:hypothetical protein
MGKAKATATATAMEAPPPCVYRVGRAASHSLKSSRLTQPLHHTINSLPFPLPFPLSPPLSSPLSCPPFLSFSSAAMLTRLVRYPANLARRIRVPASPLSRAIALGIILFLPPHSLSKCSPALPPAHPAASSAHQPSHPPLRRLLRRRLRRRIFARRSPSPHLALPLQRATRCP